MHKTLKRLTVAALVMTALGGGSLVLHGTGSDNDVITRPGGRAEQKHDDNFAGGGNQFPVEPPQAAPSAGGGKQFPVEPPQIAPSASGDTLPTDPEGGINAI